ncbi:MAG: methionyl-tRNA formyltransferase [Clostridia bacterium]|nr:methionyl-tRNA formyltransferase [Clostridia bacterium]
MRIVFMGTPDIACSILNACYRSRNEIVGVVSQPDAQVGRGKKIRFSPVKEFALEKGLHLMQPEKVKNNTEFFEELKALNPDILVVCAYGRILPKEILELPKYGAVNVHASLLPKLRGASPIQSAILLGEEKTGITIMQMAEGLDSGDMILKEEIEIGRMNHEELYNALTEIGERLIQEALLLIDMGKATFEKQNEAEATYVTTISKADGKIDFTKEPVQIERQIRAFDPWPGAYASLNDVVFKFWKADISERTGRTGEILEANANGITVACGNGSIVVKELQVPGKKRVAVKDFLLGNKVNVGDLFV